MSERHPGLFIPAQSVTAVPDIAAVRPLIRATPATPVVCCATRARRGLVPSPSGLHAFVAGGFSVGIARRFRAPRVLAIAVLVRATCRCGKGPRLRVLGKEAPWHGSLRCR